MAGSDAIISEKTSQYHRTESTLAGLFPTVARPLVFCDKATSHGILSYN